MIVVLNNSSTYTHYVSPNFEVSRKVVQMSSTLKYEVQRRKELSVCVYKNRLRIYARMRIRYRRVPYIWILEFPVFSKKGQNMVIFGLLENINEAQLNFLL